MMCFVVSVFVGVIVCFCIKEMCLCALRVVYCVMLYGVFDFRVLCVLVRVVV